MSKAPESETGPMDRGDEKFPEPVKDCDEDVESTIASIEDEVEAAETAILESFGPVDWAAYHETYGTYRAIVGVGVYDATLGPILIRRTSEKTTHGAAIMLVPMLIIDQGGVKTTVMINDTVKGQSESDVIPDRILLSVMQFNAFANFLRGEIKEKEARAVKELTKANIQAKILDAERQEKMAMRELVDRGRAGEQRVADEALQLRLKDLSDRRAEEEAGIAEAEAIAAVEAEVDAATREFELSLKRLEKKRKAKLQSIADREKERKRAQAEAKRIAKWKEVEAAIRAEFKEADRVRQSRHVDEDARMKRDAISIELSEYQAELKDLDTE